MPTTYSDGFYLGVFSDLDPNENNFWAENSENLINLVVGSAGNPLVDSLTSIGFSDTNGDNRTWENDDGQIAEGIVYDGRASNLDSVIDYYVTVTFTDGSTATTEMEILQDVSGRVFLVPYRADSLQNGVLDDHPIQSIRLDSIQGDNYSRAPQPEMHAFITCYAPGTLIETPIGPRAVEALQFGDMVNTLDHGPQPIRWIRRNAYVLEDADVDATPIQIKAGALGQKLPAHDLIVSPQHRVYVGGGGQLHQIFSHEALVPAKSLTALPGIRRMKGKTQINWIHFACERHEVVTANGCLSESLLLGPLVVNGLSSAERAAMIKLFGPAPMPDTALNGPPARECLTVGAVKRQIDRLRMESYKGEQLCEALPMDSAL